jgi:transmembrane sensor
MGDLETKLSAAGRCVEVRWTEGRALAVEAAMAQRRARRVIARRALGIVGALACLLLALGVTRRAHIREHVRSAEVAAPSQDRASVPTERPIVTPRDPASTVVTKELERTHATFELAVGGAIVDGTANPERLVRLEAGAVSVEGAGAAFTAARDGETLAVAVRHGRVRIMWGLDVAELEEGGSGTFPPTTAERAPSTPSAVAPAPSSSATWRRWARDGDFDHAFQSLKAAGPSAVKDDTGDLLLASDVARLSGHASDAVDPLRRIVRDHSSDPRAPLAAFTLGRVFLDELGRPREAASAFARARSLAPGGPLEEDALAREVEALSRAGDVDGARETARIYLETFPNGRRMRSVQRFGGLE